MTQQIGAGRPLSFAELRARQLDILDSVAEHCERHGLRWYLYAGTLLGAVRHRGYIPWDDDIDLWLPRPDYERFCRTYGDHTAERSFSVRCLESSEQYVLPFAKVCDDHTRISVESGVVEGLGVYVDVFPLDGWRDGRAARGAQRATLKALLTVVRAKHLVIGPRRSRGRNLVLWTAQAMAAPVSARTLGRWISRVARSCSFDNATEVGVLTWGGLEVFPAAAFDHQVPVPFEGRTLPSPAGTDEVLRIHYGDYWQLPPEHLRVTHHRFTAYELP